MAQAQNGLAILLQFYETHRSFRIDFNDLRSMRLIANGGFSDVYSAQFSNGDQQTVVACKELRVMLPHDQIDSDNEYKRLALELHIWVTKLLDDNYVVPIFRFTLNPRNDYPILITKYMPNGNLREYISRNPEVPIDFLAIIRHIAAGLSYLHNNEVTHGDVKCHNILMSSDENPRPLLTDFGISHVMNPGSVTLHLATDGENPRGTIRFLAKETISENTAREDFYTKQADVWAFGMTIYEILNNKAPYYELRSDAMVILAINSGRLPKWPDGDADLHSSLRGRGFQLVEKLASVCNECWKDTNERPDIKAIMVMLENIHNED